MYGVVAEADGVVAGGMMGPGVHVQAPSTTCAIPDALIVTAPGGAQNEPPPQPAGPAGGAIAKVDAVVTFTAEPLL